MGFFIFKVSTTRQINIVFGLLFKNSLLNLCYMVIVLLHCNTLITIHILFVIYYFVPHN